MLKVPSRFRIVLSYCLTGLGVLLVAGGVWLQFGFPWAMMLLGVSVVLYFLVIFDVYVAPSSRENSP